MLLNSATTQCLFALLASAFVSIVILPMLGTRTKQVFSYGRRNRRIINDRQDLFDVEDTSKSSGAARGARGLDNAVVILTTPSSPVSPPVPPHTRSKKRRENDQAYSHVKHRHCSSSRRQPLSPHSVNISQRSSLSGPKKKPRLSASRSALLPQSPAVDVDIIVLDETGRRVSQERRVSKTKVQVNQRTMLHSESYHGPEMHRHVTATIVSDSDDDDGPSPQLKRRAKRWPKVMSSDEEDVVESPIRSACCLTPPGHNTDRDSLVLGTDLSDPLIPRHSCLNPTTFPTSRFWVEIPSSRPPALSRSQPQGLTLYNSPRPLRSKHRQLTPIRRKGSSFPRFPPPPSTVTDLDVSLDFAELTLSPTPTEDYALPDQPPSLVPLLDECGQDSPVEFSAFIEAFPVHPIVWSSCSRQAVFQKIGEASYSEVFGIGDVVLKIIPIRNEGCPDRIDVDTPAPSDAKDVLKEIVVTRALGEMCNGFVNLLKTYVVRGKYPSLLLDLWDEYNQTKGSESVRPGATTMSRHHTFSLNLPRHVSRVAGLRYNRATQWWPGFGSIHVQPTRKDRLETSLQPLLADHPRSCNGRGSGVLRGAPDQSYFSLDTEFSLHIA